MSTAIITPAGFQMLEAELDRLWRVERRETVQAVSRLDTSSEVDYYRNGGILHKVLRDFVAEEEAEA